MSQPDKPHIILKWGNLGLTDGGHAVGFGRPMTAAAQPVLLLLLFLSAGLLGMVQVRVLLDRHRGRRRGREAQRGTRRAGRRRAKTSRFYVQRWRWFVIHFRSIYRCPGPPSVPAPPFSSTGTMWPWLQKGPFVLLRAGWRWVYVCVIHGWLAGCSGDHVLATLFTGAPHFGGEFNYLKIEKHRNLIIHTLKFLIVFKFARITSLNLATAKCHSSPPRL